MIEIFGKDSFPHSVLSGIRRGGIGVKDLPVVSVLEHEAFNGVEDHLRRKNLH